MSGRSPPAPVPGGAIVLISVALALVASCCTGSNYKQGLNCPASWLPSWVLLSIWGQLDGWNVLTNIFPSPGLSYCLHQLHAGARANQVSQVKVSVGDCLQAANAEVHVYFSPAQSNLRREVWNIRTFPIAVLWKAALQRKLLERGGYVSLHFPKSSDDTREYARSGKIVWVSCKREASWTSCNVV